MILTREQIADTFKLKTERVKVWDSDAEVIVRALPAHVVEHFNKGEPKADAYVFVNALVDEKGKRLYSDTQVDEVANAVSNDLIQLVVSRAFALSVVSKDRQEVIKKNWETLSASRYGGSPSPSDTDTPTNSSAA